MYSLLYRLPSRIRSFSTVQFEKRLRNNAADSNAGLSEHCTTTWTIYNPVSCKVHCSVVVRPIAIASYADSLLCNRLSMSDCHTFRWFKAVQSGLTYVIDKTKATSLDVNSSLPFFLHKMQLNQFLFVSQCDVNNRGWQVVRLSDVQTSCQAPHFNGSFDITAEVCIAWGRFQPTNYRLHNTYS